MTRRKYVSLCGRFIVVPDKLKLIDVESIFDNQLIEEFHTPSMIRKYYMAPTIRSGAVSIYIIQGYPSILKTSEKNTHEVRRLREDWNEVIRLARGDPKDIPFLWDVKCTVMERMLYMFIEEFIDDKVKFRYRIQSGKLTLEIQLIDNLNMRIHLDVADYNRED